MRKSILYRSIAVALALLLIATPGQTRRLMELDGIELRGTARVLTYGAATCHVLEEKYSAEEYERLKENEGQPLDLWQLDFSVYNGSGKALDHLIARYGIEAEWPPCTNWSETADYPGPVSWADEAGSIQRGGTPHVVAPGETVTKAIYIIAFHTDEPRFARWSVDYTFAEGAHAAPDKQPVQTEVQPPAAQPAQAVAPPPVSGQQAGISAADTCVGKAEGSSCWLELENQAGCYLWNFFLSVNETATWSGTCDGGLAEGTGEVFWIWGSDREFNATHTGQFQQGKKHGQWSDLTLIYSPDYSYTVDKGVIRTDRYINRLDRGSYVDGKRHGRWVLRDDDGDVEEGPYVDGKRHGRWVERYADGGVSEGPYVDGKRHGRWVLRYADGDVEEGPYVDGKPHGRWVQRYVNGSVAEGPYVNDERHGRWVYRFPDGGTIETPYVDGERHGRQVERDSNGTVLREVNYVNGKEQ